jgi:hypothetical protein
MHAHFRQQRLSVLCLILVVLAAMASQRATHSQTSIQFNRDIRPILSDKCFICHGPDAAAKKIKLRLDSEAAATAELSRGRRAIVPGQPDQSELVKRITHADEAMRMPPADSGRTLTKREIEMLTEWIRQGAKWETHWAFIPPVKPALPAVKNAAWPKNAIDYFVLARLEREGLQPAPEADRATLRRRLSFDLTGLPPTIEELDAFLNDRAQNAYEKVVDRLLASPRYGERMAFKWLDAARYADTNGYQIDGERFMWSWRDWVINAFNQNKPFDQFTIEQLAGDLLPSPQDKQRALDQRIATAFNRNHRQNSEDGLIPDEYAVEYVVDRVDTTSTVFLGLTMGCARCHNHKYDPLTQKEYYQLYAYFNSIPEDGRAHNYGNSPPWIAAPTTEQLQRLRRIETDIATAQTQLDKLTRVQAPLIERWARHLPKAGNAQWFPTDDLVVRHSLDEKAPVELVRAVDHIDMSKPNEKFGPKEKPDVQKTGFRDGTPAFVAAPTGQGAAFDGKLFFDAGNIANFNFRDRLIDYKDQFAISAWFRADSKQSGAIVTRIKDITFEKDYNLPKARGYGLFFNNGKLHFNIVGVWADDSCRVETAEPVSLNEWHHVVAVFDSTLPYERARIYLDGRKQTLKIHNSRLFRTFNDDSALLRIGGGGGSEYRFRGAIDEVRVYKTAPEATTVAMLACADSITAIAAIPPRKRTEGQRLKLLNAWLDQAAPATVRQPWEHLRTLKAQKVKLEAESPTVMVMQELPQPRPARLLQRGAYDAPGEIVPRGLPASLCASSAKTPPTNRLEFAQWLVSAENPLTARVTVNRFWQMFFGAGLVKTVEDFGAQGELPSHPELLDWLAVELRIADCGLRIEDCSQRPLNAWNIKRLLKTIVMSATYRQASRVTPPVLQRDPDNRLLARGSRFRLPAEMIRDQALLVSGLLVEKLGGPSVKTYQPPGLLKDMVFSNMTSYAQAKGEDLWRRSLYTYWKRTILNPSMQVFDATAREQCTVREARTNTPLQALNLMNDVTYVEAARLLAERILLAGGETPQKRLAWAFRAVTSRQPDAAELQTLQKSLDAQLAYFRQQPQAAEKLLLIGEKRNNAALNPAELAAHTMIASMLLNLDEAITKP